MERVHRWSLRHKDKIDNWNDTINYYTFLPYYNLGLSQSLSYSSHLAYRGLSQT